MSKFFTLCGLALCLMLPGLWSCGSDTPATSQARQEQLQSTDFNNWEQVVERARGQHLLFNAWGGSELINNYIAWVGEQLKAGYGIQLEQIKVGDIAITVNRVLSEFTAGKRKNGGSTDLMWINGENFRSMKENNLLFGPMVGLLPNAQFIDTSKPGTSMDAGTPTDGYEAPWGAAQLVLLFDQQRLASPPLTFTNLVEYAEANPGRVTYPKPPNYLGTTLLKQALYAVSPQPQELLKPVTDATYQSLAPELWTLIDRLHRVAWNNGTSFPSNGQDLFRLFNDKEVDFALSFSPGEAAANVQDGRLPESTRTFVFTGGTIGNTHFVAIPANSSSKEAALVAANFLLSPDAQLRKQNPRYWGDFTVLRLAAIDDETRQAFARLPYGKATLRPDDLQPTLPEPHVSWTEKLEQAWQARYL